LASSSAHLGVHLIAPLAASIATAGLIVFMRPDCFLAAAPLRYIGKISYGIYLYHWPIFILGEKWKPNNSHHIYAIGLIALIFAAAALSYEFVEKPFLRLKDRHAPAKAPVHVGALAKK
jgi:peptidoglycan/LPS O-acetylase OafA/YrhL